MTWRLDPEDPPTLDWAAAHRHFEAAARTTAGTAGDPITRSRYPDHWWGASWWSSLQMAGRHEQDIAGIKLIDPPDKSATLAELVDLVAKQQSPELELRRAEIIAESETYPSFYANAFFLDATRRPLSLEILKAVVHWSHPFIFAFKHQYKRPRPSQLEPRLRPIIACPTHPAYPSGHSTQSHLIGHVFGRLSQSSEIEKALLASADRIARNREYAGVHYASDSDAGARLAQQLVPLFERDFRDLLAKAAATEWN